MGGGAMQVLPLTTECRMNRLGRKGRDGDGNDTESSGYRVGREVVRSDREDNVL